MHGVRRELLQNQIASIGLPSSTVELPLESDMKDYEYRMDNELLKLESKGYTHIAFGDIFLSDLRKYREQQLEKINLRACFPIWKKNTTELMKEFIRLQFKAIVVSINGSLLEPSFVGRVVDESFLNDLPPTVDPCGENGEFHTFCFDGPIFNYPIEFTRGEIIQREYGNSGDSDNSANTKKSRYLFCDLIPK